MKTLQAPKPLYYAIGVMALIMFMMQQIIPEDYVFTLIVYCFGIGVIDYMLVVYRNDMRRAPWILIAIVANTGIIGFLICLTFK